MSFETTQKILRDGLIAATSVCRRLSWSQDRIADLFPLTAERVNNFTDENEERLDAYLHRFNSLLSITQDQLFKGIAILEQEDITNTSNRDKTNLMEKLGVITSAAGFSTMAELRNKLAHHYPNAAEKQAERLNAVYSSANELLLMISGILDYVVAKNLIPNLRDDLADGAG